VVELCKVDIEQRQKRLLLLMWCFL